MNQNETFFSTVLHYKGRVIGLRADQVRLKNGKESVREIVEHPGAVAMLPVLDDGRLLLIRQYRYAVDEEMWEIPAGKLEQGEELVAAAQRELAEETGYVAKSLELRQAFYTAPGFCNEKIYLYFARGLTQQLAQADEDEQISAHILTVDAVRQLISTGKIVDAKTLVALFDYLTSLKA